MVARAIEGTVASQARTTGLRAPVSNPNVGATETGSIKLRDDDDGKEELGAGACARAGPDGMSMDTFWVPKWDVCSPASSAAELGPARLEAEGWESGAYVPSKASKVDCGRGLKPVVGGNGLTTSGGKVPP